MTNITDQYDIMFKNTLKSDYLIQNANIMHVLCTNNSKILSYMLWQAKYRLKEGFVHPEYDDYFFCTGKAVQRFTNIPREAQARAMADIRLLGMIDTKIGGNPYRNHYKLNADLIVYLTRCSYDFSGIISVIFTTILKDKRKSKIVLDVKKGFPKIYGTYDLVSDIQYVLETLKVLTSGADGHIYKNLYDDVVILDGKKEIVLSDNKAKALSDRVCQSLLMSDRTPKPEKPKTTKSKPKKKGKVLRAKSHDRIHPIIVHWNKQENLGNHSISTDSNEPCSGTIWKAHVSVKKFMSGTFYANQHAPGDFPENVIMHKFSLLEIKMAISELNKAKSKTYAPVNKSALPGTINDFLCSYNTKFSWLLKYYSEPAKLLGAGMVDIPSVDLKGVNLEDFSSLVLHNNQNTKISVHKAITLLKLEYESIDKNIGLVYDKWSKYDTFMGSWSSFASYFRKYLKGYKDGIYLGHLKCTGESKSWQRFVATVRDEIDINLYPTPGEKKMITRNKKNFLIKSCDFTLDKFEEIGYYTHDDRKKIASGEYLE